MAVQWYLVIIYHVLEACPDIHCAALYIAHRLPLALLCSLEVWLSLGWYSLLFKFLVYLTG